MKFKVMFQGKRSAWPSLSLPCCSYLCLARIFHGVTVLVAVALVFLFVYMSLTMR